MSRFHQKVISQSSTPESFRKSPQVVEIPVKDHVVVGPETTVVIDPSTTVVADPTTTVQFWRAELNGAVFPASHRVRRIEIAQDALTHAEENVYDCLWGPKNSAKDDFRLVRIGYDRIAKASRITKRNAALVIERLIEKGFVRIEQPADTQSRMPTQYRVLSYRAALDEMNKKRRRWVVRSGNGVLFVHQVTITHDSTTTVVADQTTTVVADPETTVVAERSTTVVAATTVTVVAGASTTVVAATTPLDNKKTETERQTSSSMLNEAFQRNGLILDAAAERTLRKRCQTYDSAATDQEIAYFAENKIAQLRKSRNVGNWIGLLMTAVPEFFVPPAHELQRYREGKNKESAKARTLANEILRDLQASEQDREWARSTLDGLASLPTGQQAAEERKAGQDNFTPCR